MDRFRLRPLTGVLAVAGLVAIAVGVAGGIAAADPPDHANDGGNASEDGFELHLELHAAGTGGWLSIDCTGTPADHDCEKAGTFDGGPTGIDYEGHNDADIAERSGGGGDTIVVTVDDHAVLVTFDCEFDDVAAEENPCPAGVDPDHDHRPGTPTGPTAADT